MTTPQPSADAMAAAAIINKKLDELGSLYDGEIACLIDEAFAGVRREMDEAVALVSLSKTVLRETRREREALREGLRELTSAELVSCDSNPSADAGDKENGACMTCYACKQLAKARALLASGGGK